MTKNWIAALAFLLAAAAQAPAAAAFPGANGRLAFATFSNIFSATPKGENLHQLSDPRTGKNRLPAWSADGKHIAFVCHANAYSMSKGSELCAMRADGSHVHRLTHNDVGEGSPSWSPDGRWIAFVRATRGLNDMDVWVMRSDGTGKRNLTPDSFPDFSPSWSPDGREILFMSARPTGDPLNVVVPEFQQDLFAVTVGDGSIRNITDSPEHEDSGDWSPDGLRIVMARYDEVDQGGWSLYVMSSEGGAATKITNGIFCGSPAWSPDGGWIAFSAITDVGPQGSLDGKSQILKIRPDGTDLTVVTLNPRRSYYSPSWQPLPDSAE